mmetsp:Transcript_21872/g.62733  ORF Transcript_21872/g.62733 Transcript_21872/m.62733 type:complete len:372 (+) Transcript_21872:140-1255(+)
MSSEAETESKRIRSSEPDLKVIIGSASDVGGERCGEKNDAEHNGVVTKWYHSQTLATKSKYIDALLAAPMKESESRTITFPDIAPETWELMVKFIDDPIACRSMKAEDVVKVAKFYDKYDFGGGRNLCDLILFDYFKSVRKDESVMVVPDVDFIVASVVLADEANLGKAFEEGMKFIWEIMNCMYVPVGRTMFSEEHMKKLAPLLEKTTDAIYMCEKRLKCRYGDLKSDTFPIAFVKNCSNWLTHHIMCNFISRIKVSGSYCAVDGDYEGRPPEFCANALRKVRWDGVLNNVSIELRTKEEGWAIILKTIPPLDEEGEPDHDSIVETIAWKAPHSGNMPLPPSKGWISAHPRARGELKLAYILKEGEVELW